MLHALALVALVGWTHLAQFFACDTWWGPCAFVGTSNGATADWRYFAGTWEAARVAVESFGQFPGWNPYHCGGVPLFADPQTPVGSPWFWLAAWWLPAGGALKLWLFVHALVGALGMDRWARDEGHGRLARLCASAVLVGCGFVAHHAGGGHVSFSPFHLLPWLLWWARQPGPTTFRRVSGGALLVALMVLEGGVYPFAFGAVIVGVDACARSLATRSAAPLRLVLGWWAAGSALAAVRLIPTASLFVRFPRPPLEHDALDARELVATLLLPTHARTVEGHPFVWDEYGNYVGALVLAWAALGIAASWVPRPRRTEAAVLTVLLALTAGAFAPWSPWSLLHHLPVFASLRVPSRFGAGVSLFLGLLAARGISAIEARWVPGRRGAVRFLLTLVVFATIADLVGTNGPVHGVGSDRVLPTGPAADHAFEQVAGLPYDRWPTNPMRGVGQLECYVAIAWQPSPRLWTSPHPFARLEPPDAGTIDEVRWSPSRIDLTLSVTRPATLQIDENVDDGWTAEGGTLVTSDGVLAVSVEPGTPHVRLRHHVPGLRAGAALSLVVALFLGIGTLLDAKRTSRREGGHAQRGSRG